MTLIEKTKAVNYFRTKLEFTVGPVELAHMLEDRVDLTILDVRAEEDYNKGHIPGAINVPKERWDTFEGLSMARRHVVYCYSQQCHLAAAACVKFATRGFRVLELEGGIQAWQQLGFQMEGVEAGRCKAA